MSMFDLEDESRQKEQKAVEKKAMTSREETEQRAVLSLSLSASDKVKLKTYAAQEGKTIARIIHEWIEQHID